MTRRVLVTGGTGFVGSHVVEAYLAAGWAVRAAVRDPARLGWLKDKLVDIYPFSFANSESLSTAVRGCDVVVHCAAITKTPRREDYYRINSQAVENLAVVAREAGVRRFVLCSSHAASGPAQDGIASREDDLPEPLTDYGKSKLEGEQNLQKVAGSMERVILRPPSVLGPRDEQFLPLFRAVSRFGIYPQLGSAKRMYSYIYVKDLARALLMAGETQNKVNEIFFVAHPEPLDWQRAAMVIAQLAGRRARAVVVPVFAAKAIGRVNDVFAHMTDRPALLSSDKVLEMLAAGWVCSPDKIQREWNFVCTYSTEDALRETFEFYRQTHRL